MNKFVSIVLGLVAFTFGALVFQQRNQISLLQENLTLAHKERDAARDGLKQIQAELAALKERNTFLASERDQLREKKDESQEITTTTAETTTPNAAQAAGQTPGSAEGIAKMMQSPEMKKMIRTQMERQTRKSFGDVLTKWNLSTENSDLVMNLLTERSAIYTDSGLEMFQNGKMDEEAMKKAGEEMTAKREGYDAQLKSLLGEERFKELEDHQRTESDRSMIAQYEEQFNEAGTPLKQDQSAALVKMMSEERAKAHSPAINMDEKKGVPESLQKMYSEEGMLEWKKEEETFQNRVLSRAAETLTPDQVITLKNALKEQSEMMEMGLKMGREMFAPAPSGKAEAKP